MKNLFSIVLLLIFGLVLVQQTAPKFSKTNDTQTEASLVSSDFDLVVFSVSPIVYECQFINNYAPFTVRNPKSGFTDIEIKPPIEQLCNVVLIDKIKTKFNYEFDYSFNKLLVYSYRV